MKRISSAVRILETDDEVQRAAEEIRRERDNRRESDEVLESHIDPPRVNHAS